MAKLPNGFAIIFKNKILLLVLEGGNAGKRKAEWGVR